MFGDSADPVLLTRRAPSTLSYVGEVLSADAVSVEEVHDVLIFRDYVQRGFCTSMLDFFTRRSDWVKSVTYGELESLQDPATSPRQSHQINLDRFPCVDSFVFKIFNQALEKLKERYELVDITSDEGYSLLRYTPGGEYKAHVDFGRSNGRVLSGLVYLNDDYVGGELYFPRHDLKVTPEAGMVVLFPSSYTHLHASLPIESGTKYSIVTWFK